MAEKVSLCFDFFIQRKIQDDPIWQSISIHFSDSNTIGEGEHKIMNHLKLHCKKEDSICVYGMDADLILLSMLLPSDRVYILREAVLIETVYTRYSKLLQKRRKWTKKKKSNVFASADEKNFQIVKINQLLQCLQEEYSIPTNEMNLFCLDYIFVSFFFGNDFIPSLPHLSSMQESVFDSIFQLFKTFKLHLIQISNPNKVRIVFENVLLFLKQVSKTETLYFDSMHTEVSKTPSLKKNSSSQVFVQTTIHPLENSNLISLFDFDHCQVINAIEESNLKKVCIKSALVASSSSSFSHRLISPSNTMIIKLQFKSTLFVSSILIQNHSFDEQDSYKMDILIHNKSISKITLHQRNQQLEHTINKQTNHLYILIHSNHSHTIQIDTLLCFGREVSIYSNIVYFQWLQSSQNNWNQFKDKYYLSKKEEMIQNYWNMMEWIINYYYSPTSVPFDMYYSFYHSPLLNDLLTFKWKHLNECYEMNALSPLEQLIHLYPTAQLLYLLPTTLSNALQQILHHKEENLFFNLNLSTIKSFTKPTYNETILELPFFNRITIQEQFQLLCKNSKEEEQVVKRNELHDYHYVEYECNVENKKNHITISSPIQALPDIYDCIATKNYK